MEMWTFAASSPSSQVDQLFISAVPFLVLFQQMALGVSDYNAVNINNSRRRTATFRARCIAIALQLLQCVGECRGHKMHLTGD